MKKFLSFLFVCLLAFLIVGCNQNNGGDKPEDKPGEDTTKYSLTLNEADKTVSLEVGGEKKITVTFEGGTLEWTSSDSTVVSVENGTLKALKAGTATITVTLKEKTEYTATITVTVTEPAPVVVEVTGIALAGKKTEVEVGEEFTLSTVITPNNATDKTVTWASSDATVATVTDGKVKALKAGTTEISATAGAKSDKFTLTVKEKEPEVVDPEDIYLDHQKETMVIGETEKLSYGVDPEEASQEVEWSFDKEGVVSVSEDGTLTALKGGLVTIKVSPKGHPEISDSYQLRVYDNVEGMTVTYAKTMQLASSQTLAVSVDKQRADGTPITTVSVIKFESLDTNILTVDEKGVVTAVAAGTAKVKVYADDSDQFTVECEINVIVAVIKNGDKTYNSLTTALAEAQSGDIIVLGNGVYSGEFEIATDNLTILGPNYGIDAALSPRAAEAEFIGTLKVKSGVKNLVVDGLAFTGAGSFSCVGAGENIQVRNLYIHDTAEKAWSEGRDNNTPSSVDFNHMNNDIELKDVVISHCYFEKLHWAGLYIARLYNVKVEYCTFYNFDQDAIRGDGGYNNGKWEFYYNKFYNDELKGTNGIYLQSVSGDQILQEIFIEYNEFKNIGDKSKESLNMGAFSCRTYQECGMRFYFKYNVVDSCLNGLHVRNNGESDLTKYTEEINYNVFKNIEGFLHRNFNGSGDTETSNPVEANFNYNLFLDAEGKALTYEQIKDKLFEVKSCEGTFASEAELTAAILNTEAGFTKYVSPEFAGKEAGTQITLGALTLTMGTDAFATVKDAVEAAADNDIIYVAAGTYEDAFTISKSIKLAGPNAGVKGYEVRLPEAILTGKIEVAANNVTIDGFTIMNETSFPKDATIDGFKFLNHILTGYNGEGYINSYGGSAGDKISTLSNVTVSGNYSPKANGPRWMRFAKLNGLELSNNIGINLGNVWSWVRADIYLMGEVNITGNFFDGSNQDCFMIMGVGAMTLTIKDNYFRGMVSTVVDTRNMVADVAGDVTEYIINNVFDQAGASWRCLRPRNADYGDNKLDVQVHYNSFINGCYTEIEGVKTYANNPAGTDVIYNMDNNYFQEVEAAEVSNANFAGVASSWAGCFDSFVDVRWAYELSQAS